MPLSVPDRVPALKRFGFGDSFQGQINTTLEETSMAKQPEFSKYLPLEEWFRNQPTTAEQIELTFTRSKRFWGLLCLPQPPG